jgi:Zn-dependent protease with chaperone function
VLAPPTAYVLSRLLSRERVIEADRRAVELTRNRAGALAALRNLEGVEYTAGEPFWAALRFSLFVTPRAQTGLGPWRERVFGTHPPVAARIEQLGRLTQDGSRRQPIPDGARDPLEQSG